MRPAGHTLAAVDESAALEQLHELGCTDGLPVLVPTAARVDRLVQASGMEPDLELGIMGPGFGSVTVEKLCASAVMAGCLPEHMPVLLAAVQAVLDPQFDLTEMQATTFGTAPLIVVNGPARQMCGPIASGTGALGPGHRANASIGRALRLAMINLGGGHAGTADMALLGHGGKFTACLAEDEEASPFEPLHIARGLGSDASAVTVIGTEAPHSVMFLPQAETESPTELAERLLATLAAALCHPGSNNYILRGGAALVALNPEHAHTLHAAGYDRSTIADALVAATAATSEDLQRWIPALRGRAKPVDLPAFATPDDVLVIVAGGSGLYSAVFPTWCAGPNTNRAVTVAFDPAPSCVLPSAPAAPD